jgi:hypothetical protein
MTDYARPGVPAANQRDRPELGIVDEREHEAKSGQRGTTEQGGGE